MIKENSGLIYRFPLDFGLGYAYAWYDDYTDISTFNGRLVKVFRGVYPEKDNPSIEEIKASELLFGSVMLYKNIPTRGKYAWKLVGKVAELDEKVPDFKYLRGMLIEKDWSQLSPWYRIEDLNKSREQRIYEELRHLEPTILNSHIGIGIRTSMLILMERGEDVFSYYDMKDRGMRNLLEHNLNTVLSLEEAQKYFDKLS